MKTLTTLDGHKIPVLGQGTWKMGDDPGARAQEVRALRVGMDLGMTLIDTAEMYASGASEEVVGKAVEGRRDEAYLVTKVLPQNATYHGTREACERSLRRLATDRIDLYLLHWASPHPLEDTLRAFVDLKQEGKIRSYGVSNFDTAAMREARELPGGDGIASNQILYNLVRRGPEHDLMPWCRENNVFVMAYSPVEEGALTRTEALDTVAKRHGISPYGVAIAWSMRGPGTVSIPKAASESHVRDNARAAAVTLTEEDVALLDTHYPRPAPGPLETG